MAEQATRIADQDEGDFVATRDAYEQDGDTNNRVIQLIDWAGRQLTITTLRGGTPVTTADGVDLTGLPADLTGNLLTVGDKTVLTVIPEHSAEDGGVFITPIVFDSAGTTVVATRATKSSSMGTVKFRHGAASGNYSSPQLEWDVMGAVKIGLHITQIDGTTNGIVLKGGLI